RPDQRGWYEPYQRDVNGQAVDEVIDWAALEYKVLRQDKVVATLMVLAAEAVKSGKRAPDYWQAERRWVAGETSEIMREPLRRVPSALPPSCWFGPEGRRPPPPPLGGGGVGLWAFVSGAAREWARPARPPVMPPPRRCLAPRLVLVGVLLGLSW